MIEFAQLAQLRETQNVEKAQKQILSDQLEELDKKLAEMQEVRDLLIYKIEKYDDHIAKFKAGEGIKRANNDGLVTREELFVTSKLFILQAPEEKAAETIEHSLEEMGLDYLDLYLIHQPYGDIYGAWRSMVAAQKAGKLRAIGISNFKSAKMIEFVGLNEVIPQINQIEVNPWNQRVEDQEWH